MIRNIIIKETGPTPRIAKREQARIMRAVLSESAAYYHRHYMPKHFTKAGAREYGYTKRKGEDGSAGKRFWSTYTGRKQREKGHTLPLVWSGASRQLAKIRDIRATRKRARIVQHARALNFKTINSNVDMSREITTISDNEAREVVQYASQRFNHYYSAITRSHTSRA